MSKVIAGITMSVDGYITGPDDGPGCGLGTGGERLHYWVFGGPWSYHSPGPGRARGRRQGLARHGHGQGPGAVILGRATYEAAGHWGGTSPGGCRSSSSLTGLPSSRQEMTSFSPAA